MNEPSCQAAKPSTEDRNVLPGRAGSTFDLAAYPIGAMGLPFGGEKNWGSFASGSMDNGG
jgi:hypothetical protein